MIINDLDGYYIVFDTKNWNTELDTLIIKTLNELTLHLLREDGLGGLWNVDGSLKLAAITKSH